MIVLGLDQSSNTGWAVGEPGAKPRYGVYEVPDFAGHEGRTIRALKDWLVNFIKSEGVEHVFWEGVYIPPQAKVDINKIFKLISFANAVQLACCETNTPDGYVVVGEWRNHFLGTAAGGTDVLKAMAVRQCFDRGWGMPDSHHAAEACGIWDLGCTKIDKNYRWLSRPATRRAEIKAEAEDRVRRGVG